jgi:D-alanine-D-alanine ligase
MSDEAWHIATDRVKFNSAYQKKHGIRTEHAKGLSSEETTRIHNLCKRAYRALGMSGYARIDLRRDEGGRVYILEANPNPQLAYGEDFAESAEAGGIPYSDLLQRILNLGLRWRPEQRG